MCNSEWSSEELRRNIEEAIVSSYQDFNYSGEGDVLVVENKKVRIMFNTQKPYMGKYLWMFLGTVIDKVDAILMQHGYKYARDKYFYDILTWEYEYFPEENM